MTAPILNSASATLAVRVRKRFVSPESEFLLEVDFVALPGFTILFGPSGAGKTTLLDCVAGLALPTEGRIAIGNHVLFERNVHRNSRANHRESSQANIPVAKRHMGYVLQDLALFPHFTVAQNAEYGIAHLPRTDRKQRAAAMLEEFRIGHLCSRLPGETSGGERQRAALARALVTDPCVLLLDEPLAALDAPTKGRILDDLRRWNQAHHIPILYVTHSREEVLALGDHVLVLENGRILAQGTPHQVLRAPLQETVAQLAGFENIFDAAVESIHEDRGTMICNLLAAEDGNFVPLETPLVRANIGAQMRVGIRAGDILLAIAAPAGLSARNVITGKLISLDRRDMMIAARVDCGVEMEVYLTLAARDALRLQVGQGVWLVIKTHSCHLMQK